MILCVECGNTCIKVGVFDENNTLLDHFLIKSESNLTSYEYAFKLRNLLKKEYSFEGSIISSVIPHLTSVLKNAVKEIIGIEPLILNKSLKTKLPIKIDNPNELGTDFLCTALGSLYKGYKPPFIVADLGTATKISVIDKNGALIGCIITSGMATSLKALINNTAQLFEVEIAAPKKIIGKNSKDSIQSGIVFGQAYMVSEFARRIEQEIGYPITRILTGGYSSRIKDQIVCFNYEENLSLYGLNRIYKMNVEE